MPWVQTKEKKGSTICLTLYYMLAIAVNKTDKNLSPHTAYILVEKKKNQKRKGNIYQKMTVGEFPSWRSG